MFVFVLPFVFYMSVIVCPLCCSMFVCAVCYCVCLVCCSVFSCVLYSVICFLFAMPLFVMFAFVRGCFIVVCLGGAYV